MRIRGIKRGSNRWRGRLWVGLHVSHIARQRSRIPDMSRVRFIRIITKQGHEYEMEELIINRSLGFVVSGSGYR